MEYIDTVKVFLMDSGAYVLAELSKIQTGEADPRFLLALGVSILCFAFLLLVTLLRGSQRTTSYANPHINQPSPVSIGITDLASQMAKLLTNVKENQLYIQQEMIELRNMLEQVSRAQRGSSGGRGVSVNADQLNHLFESLLTEVSTVRADVTEQRRILGAIMGTPSADPAAAGRA